MNDRVVENMPGAGVVDFGDLGNHIAIQQNSAQDLSEAIIELEKRYPRAADVIQMKFFAFMTVDEICNVSSLSKSTVGSEAVRHNGNQGQTSPPEVPRMLARLG